MRMLTTLTLSAALLTLSACSQSQMRRESTSLSRVTEAPQATVSTATESAQMSAGGGSKARNESQVQDVSLNQAAASQNVAAVSQRKIIRNATLSIEIDAPTDGQRRIA